MIKSTISHPLSVRLPLFDEIFAGKFQADLASDGNVHNDSYMMDEDKIEIVSTIDPVKTSRSKGKQLADRTLVDIGKGT